MTDAPLCFLDTETTGVHPDREAWEIAAIRREPDGTETELHAFIDVDLRAADPFGLLVGRFYERHPLGRLLSGRHDDHNDHNDLVPILEAATEIARITHGAHIVGAVPNFDTETLARLLRAAGIAPAWHYHLIDVENLAVGYLASQDKPLAPPWDSDQLTELLGLEPVPEHERHTALGDARWAMRIYDRILNPDGAR